MTETPLADEVGALLVSTTTSARTIADIVQRVPALEREAAADKGGDPIQPGRLQYAADLLLCFESLAQIEAAVEPVREDFRTSAPDGYPDPLPDLVTVIQGLVAEHQKLRATTTLRGEMHACPSCGDPCRCEWDGMDHPDQPENYCNHYCVDDELDDQDADEIYNRYNEDTEDD